MKMPKMIIFLFVFMLCACCPLVGATGLNDAEKYCMGTESAFLEGTFSFENEDYDVYAYIDLKGIETYSVLHHSTGEPVRDEDIYSAVLNSYFIKSGIHEWRYISEVSKMNFLNEVDLNDDEIAFFGGLDDSKCSTLIQELRKTTALLSEYINYYDRIISICDYVDGGGNDAKKINEIESYYSKINEFDIERMKMYNTQKTEYENAYDSMEDYYYYEDDLAFYRKDSASSLNFVMTDIEYHIETENARVKETAEIIERMYDLSEYRISEYDAKIAEENKEPVKTEDQTKPVPFIGAFVAGGILLAASKIK